MPLVKGYDLRGVRYAWRDGLCDQASGVCGLPAGEGGSGHRLVALAHKEAT
jgi:hypothetical protein